MLFIIHSCFKSWEISVFCKRLQIQMWNNPYTSKVIIYSLATLFLTYLPLVTLRSPSKLNDISSAKGTIFPTIGQAESFIDLLNLRTLLYATSAYGNSFLGQGETGSTWHVGLCLACCTRPGWWMMTGVEQSVEWLAGEAKYRRKPAPVPLCPPQISHNLNWARTRTGDRLSYGTAKPMEISEKLSIPTSDESSFESFENEFHRP
jgi:hypothetical protein